MSNDEFGLMKQRLLIEYMLADETVFQRCRNILKSTYFDPELVKVVDVIISHANEYNALPTVDQISAETSTKIDLLPDVREQDQSWAMNNIEKFCQQGAIIEAVEKSFEYIESGDHGTIETMIREAVLVSLQKDIGLDYFHDPRARLERLKLKNLIPLGWRDLDRKLYGGVNRGEITIFIAGSGVGKSLFLQNACLNWISGVSYAWNDEQEPKIFEPMNVMYISLELSQDLTSKRIDSMVTGINAREIFAKIDDVELKVVSKGKKSGKFTIKYLPQGSTANDIRALIKEYEIVNGFIPDCIAVDYLDEMSPIDTSVKADNLYLKDQKITGDLRDMSIELDVVLITASQMNRTAVDESEQNQSMIAGGISKVQRADNVVSLYRGASDIANDTFQCTFLKTRSSSGVGSKVKVQFNSGSMRITDYDGDDDDDTDVSTDGTSLRNSSKHASNNDILKSIKKGPPKPTTATISDDIFNNGAEVESSVDRLKRLKDSNSL